MTYECPLGLVITSTRSITEPLPTYITVHPGRIRVLAPHLTAQVELFSRAGHREFLRDSGTRCGSKKAWYGTRNGLLASWSVRNGGEYHRMPLGKGEGPMPPTLITTTAEISPTHPTRVCMTTQKSEADLAGPRPVSAILRDSGDHNPSDPPSQQRASEIC